MVISALGLLVPMGVFAQSAQENLSVVVPNELGRIPILEYHQVGPKSDRWTRSFDEFRKDLEWLYNNDYRAISMQDFMNQRIAVPYGKKPVVFTFDDGGYTQMNFKDGQVDPYTAVGVMDEFFKVHPDFGSAAIFYINKHPFKLTPNTKEAIQYLLKTGREIGNHTLTHANLSLLDAAGVVSEIQKQEEYVQSLQLGAVTFDSIAYPFGGVPKGAALTTMAKKYRLGLLVGADPAWAPWHAKYDAMRVPRIQAIDDEWKRWFTRGKGETARDADAEIFQPYVSDGRADTVIAQDLKGLDKSKIRSGLVAQVWDGAIPQMAQGVMPLQVSVSIPPVQHQIDVSQKMAAPLVKVPRPAYPYDECKDPEADTYINYKKKGVLVSPDIRGWDWKYVGMVPEFVKHWVSMMQKKTSVVRGIYFTGSTATNETGKNLTKRLLAAGGNMVTFDLDESEGALTYGKPDQKPLLKDMRAFIDEMHAKNILVVARIVAFKERRVLFARPDLAIQSAGGGVWKDNKGSAWLDPSNPQTVQYVIDMAKEAAAMGVDEVQFDYVRFPTEGNLAAARYKFDSSKKQKWEVIRDFMREARKQTIPAGVKLSADIFGIVGWQKGYDAKTTGQRIECIAPYLDVIYPMGYPSHFGPGFGGHKNPADEPYFFTWQTAKYFVEYAEGTEVAIRPWLQSFTYRVTIPYNSDYIYQQMKGAREAGSDGFVLWNASNTYDIAWPAIGK